MKKITRKSIMKKLGGFVSVNNLQSSNYNDVANQFELQFDNGILFQSYSSIIAIKLYGDRTLYLTEEHDYSRTTSKYCTQWCGHDTKERRDMLEDGRAIMVKN